MPDYGPLAASWASIHAHPLPKHEKRKSPSVYRWQAYKDIEPPARMDVSGWPGMCVPMGGISRVEGIEFDADEKKDEHGVKVKIPGTAQDTFSAFCAALITVNQELFTKLFTNGYLERSPSGGLHVYIRHLPSSAPIPGNEKWARYRSGKTKIETRGDGGQFVVAPSDGYEIVSGAPHQIPFVSQEERNLLHSIAGQLSEKVVLVQPRPDHEPEGGLAYVSPRGWEGIFEDTDSGWTEVDAHGSNLAAGFTKAWARPGHVPSEESGEYSAVSSDAVLMVFSTTAQTELEDLGYPGREKSNGSRTYTMAEVYAAYTSGASLYADDQKGYQRAMLGLGAAKAPAPVPGTEEAAEVVETTAPRVISSGRRPRPRRKLGHDVSVTRLLRGQVD